MFSATPFSSRASSASPRALRPIASVARTGEYGWASWIYSKQAKLNAWSWSGLGPSGRASIHAWAQLRNTMYLRRDNDAGLYVMRPDVFFDPLEANEESQSVYAQTQWLDFGKPGRLKGITGMDFDGVNVTSIEFYIAVDGLRIGTPVLAIPIGDAQGGWTYSGGVIPLELASTEFMLLFVGDAKQEVQINRFTAYWSDLGAA